MNRAVVRPNHPGAVEAGAEANLPRDLTSSSRRRITRCKMAGWIYTTLDRRRLHRHHSTTRSFNGWPQQREAMWQQPPSSTTLS